MSTEIKPSTCPSAKDFVKVSIEVYPSKSIYTLWRRLLFCLKAKKDKHLIEAFYKEINQLAYGHIFKLEPTVLGNLVWPYIHKDWNVSQRFSRIAKHYALLKDMPKFLDVSDGLPKEIVSLNAFSPNTSIVLDKPRWFVREGEIVLNIFHDELRVMSLAFCLGHHNNKITLYVGGIQGIHAGIPSETSLEIIRQLTKDLHGLRPRSFVIALLRIIATRIGATNILAIDQMHRHHLHPFFKSGSSIISKVNYDEVWKDHEGLAGNDGFYQLKSSAAHKNLIEIDSKKRSMYRKRFEMLDQIEQQISMLA